MAGAGIVREMKDGTLELAVLVSAGSSKAGLRGIHGEALKLAVHSPPERGRANSEAEGIIAGWLGVSGRNVRVVSGPSSRNKVVKVAGVGLEAVKGKIAGLKRP